MTIVETIATHPVSSFIAILCVAFLAIIALAPAIMGTEPHETDIRKAEELERAERAAQAASDEAEFGPLK